MRSTAGNVIRPGPTGWTLARDLRDLLARLRSILAKPTPDWRPHYAWLPVTLVPGPGPQVAWMEWVERRSIDGTGAVEHRTLQS